MSRYFFLSKLKKERSWRGRAPRRVIPGDDGAMTPDHGMRGMLFFALPCVANDDNC